MSAPLVVIGAGMGGLCAALRLARRGLDVTVLEARASAGGLASSFEVDGFRFDAGPYILLDKPGLEWAFQSLGLSLQEHVELFSVEHVYEVAAQGEPPVTFHASEEETATGMERTWPGSGARYRKFVEKMWRIHARLRPSLFVSRPRPLDVLLDAPFLFRSLGSVLRASGLPRPVIDAIAIWTHVAAQTLDAAPSPMAFVPALIHRAGCYLPRGGIGRIPVALAAAAAKLGVQFRFGEKVRTIRVENGRAAGVETERGFQPARAVISNASGVGTYLGLTHVPERARRRLEALPLQSPGACAYLAVSAPPRAPYLRFRLDQGFCRCLVLPGVVDASVARAGEWPARLISPAPDGLDRMLDETWWREQTGPHRVLATRTPRAWGEEMNLFRQSMNPVMTASFMRQGRLAHRSPWVRGLYLAGSSTHPGQWVSFCAISGVLAADALAADL